MRSYDIENADYVLTYSIRGILGDSWSASEMGEEYIPHDEGSSDLGYISKYYDLEPDAQKALWWYELAKSNGSTYADEEITYCKEYIKNGGISK